MNAKSYFGRSFAGSAAYFRHTKYNNRGLVGPVSKTRIVNKRKPGAIIPVLKDDGFIDQSLPKHQALGTNGPLIPRDPEREAEAIRIKHGIPLIGPVVNELLDVS